MKLFQRKKQAISKKRREFIKASPKKNKIQSLYQELIDSFELLAKINYKMTMKEFKYLLILAFCIGVVLGLLLKMPLLCIVFSITFPFLLIQSIILKKSEVEHYIEKQVISYAELIKNSILSSGSVLVSLKEISKRMQTPTKEVFDEMLNEVEIYNYPLKTALLRMNQKIHSQSLKELTEQLILCDRDGRYITSLQTTTAFLNDKKEFMQMWDYRVKDIIQKVFMMVILLNILVLSTFFTFSDMMKIFLASPASKIIIPVFVLVQIIVVLLILNKIKKVSF